LKWNFIIFFGRKSDHFFQLLQNFFNWFSTTMFWLAYTPFYNRMLPIFAPANNQVVVRSRCYDIKDMFAKNGKIGDFELNAAILCLH
jgi:hypothetical protein